MTSKKLASNGLWNASVMMLPEHKILIQQANRKVEQLEQPELDEQEREEIGRKLVDAFSARMSVELVVYGEYGLRSLIGTIDKVDRMGGRILVAGQWIAVRDILEVRD